MRDGHGGREERVETEDRHCCVSVHFLMHLWWDFHLALYTRVHIMSCLHSDASPHGSETHLETFIESITFIESMNQSRVVSTRLRLQKYRFIMSAYCEAT